MNYPNRIGAAWVIAALGWAVLLLGSAYQSGVVVTAAAAACAVVAARYINEETHRAHIQGLRDQVIRLQKDCEYLRDIRNKTPEEWIRELGGEAAPEDDPEINPSRLHRDRA